MKISVIFKSTIEGVLAPYEISIIDNNQEVRTKNLNEYYNDSIDHCTSYMYNNPIMISIKIEIDTNKQIQYNRIKIDEFYYTVNIDKLDGIIISIEDNSDSRILLKLDNNLDSSQGYIIEEKIWY